MKFSKIIVTLIIVLNILFTAVVLAIFAKTATEPVVLIGAWFGFTTGELWMLSSIKKTETKNGGMDYGEDQLETETYEP